MINPKNICKNALYLYKNVTFAKFLYMLGTLFNLQISALLL